MSDYDEGFDEGLSARLQDMTKMENKYISLLAKKEKELATLRRENQETREFIGSIAKGLAPKKLCDGCGHYHILDSDYALMVQYAKSFLPKSEGKGVGG